ncbi:MAG: hypothetical protein NTU49_05350, partial [Gammaproteobacteria bacterium]|nr:hypothetical protein [Gammaproteobacteria bacterium]
AKRNIKNDAPFRVTEKEKEILATVENTILALQLIHIADFCKKQNEEIEKLLNESIKGNPCFPATDLYEELFDCSKKYERTKVLAEKTLEKCYGSTRGYYPATFNTKAEFALKESYVPRITSVKEVYTISDVRQATAALIHRTDRINKKITTFVSSEAKTGREILKNARCFLSQNKALVFGVICSVVGLALLFSPAAPLGLALIGKGVATAVAANFMTTAITVGVAPTTLSLAFKGFLFGKNPISATSCITNATGGLAETKEKLSVVSQAEKKYSEEHPFKKESHSPEL